MINSSFNSSKWFIICLSILKYYAVWIPLPDVMGIYKSKSENRGNLWISGGNPVTMNFLVGFKSLTVMCMRVNINITCIYPAKIQRVNKYKNWISSCLSRHLQETDFRWMIQVIPPKLNITYFKLLTQQLITIISSKQLTFGHKGIWRRNPPCAWWPARWPGWRPETPAACTSLSRTGTEEDSTEHTQSTDQPSEDPKIPQSMDWTSSTFVLWI